MFKTVIAMLENIMDVVRIRGTIKKLDTYPYNGEIALKNLYNENAPRENRVYKTI